MGENFVNYQVRSNSTANVVDVVKNITREKAYVSPPDNGWITVYDRTSEDFNPDEIYYFARQLSSRLYTITLALIVCSYFGYSFIYLLYESGQIVDEFFDNPDSFEFGFSYANKDIIQKFQGKPHKLIQYCLTGTTF